MKYYLHDTNSFQDEKITALYQKFGYEGLGLFYTFLEKIAAQEQPINTDVLKFQLKVGKKLEKCWNFMESIGLLSSNNGETFNKQLLNFAGTYQIKSEKNRKKVAEWREKQKDIKNVTGNEPIRNTPKVKESKVKESKEAASPLVVVESLELLVQEFNKIKKSEYKATDKLKPKWLAIKKQGYTIENVLNRSKNAMESDFHKQNNHKHLSVEFFTRTDKLDMWLNAKPKTQQPHTSAGYLQNITGII
jgi:hypothetical protein